MLASVSNDLHGLIHAYCAPLILPDSRCRLMYLGLCHVIKHVNAFHLSVTNQHLIVEFYILRCILICN